MDNFFQNKYDGFNQVVYLENYWIIWPNL